MKNQLSTTEVEELDQILAQVDESLLKGWDRTFLSDFRTKFEQYAARTYVSPKQWVHLRRIYEDNTDLKPDAPNAKVRRGTFEEEDPDAFRRDLDDEVPF